ncbi:gephyrin-like molybdotransferase Glp [Duganella violaceipulchra]|uniref:Molybdenum cofactor guanylyltransferase n=1 Tax=Duganella violaceipulchra TaxID=2849652 RepID=A0AA41L1T1_9BURK|nr:gephyrin-like molybdotransferase Glp [Duganella violaceicalia]MBV6321313.1 molybdenum cofactor guanylyltransferase [Duganella violaceicalia]MCP2009439.1 molybdopterin molybdotransferase [Duganella violaceicalia]
MSLKSKVTGLILAGGRGTRMGRVDKGLQPFRGATLVEHVMRRLAPQTATVVINANRNLPQYQAVAGAAPVLPDYLDGFEGPLAGLQIGLQYCPTELLLTAPCDSPFLPEDLAERLYAAMLAQDTDVALAVTMESEDGAEPHRQTHPVFALLKASLLPQLDAYLDTGARRMESWFKSLRVAEVMFDQADAFRNINTLAELQQHERTPAPAATTVRAADPGALPVAEAQRIICERVAPVAATERLALRDALDRVLAEDIISPINVPAYDNSAMDGYALRSADLPPAGAPDATFKVIGIAYAGRPCAQVPQAGECIRIMTGAAIPPGCDSVLPQELAAHIGEDSVTIRHGAIRTGANRRFAGEDLKAGGIALAQGKIMRPADLGLVASLGIGEVAVRRKLRVAFFSTGDELRSLGEPLDDGCVYDSNRYTLFGMLTRLGCDVIDMGIVRDDPAALEAALLDACANADAILTSGGVSEGAADYTRDILGRIGDVAFWKLAMRPGRPLAFGQIRSVTDSAWLFGLPGNPVAVMVSFYLFARPALLRMMGTQATQQAMQARSTAAIRKRPGRTEYQRGIVSAGADGAPQVRLTGAQGSGILSSMTEANCIVVLHEAQADIAAGEMVEVLLFDGLI